MGFGLDAGYHSIDGLLFLSELPDPPASWWGNEFEEDSPALNSSLPFFRLAVKLNKFTQLALELEAFLNPKVALKNPQSYKKARDLPWYKGIPNQWASMRPEKIRA